MSEDENMSTALVTAALETFGQMCWSMIRRSGTPSALAAST